MTKIERFTISDEVKISESFHKKGYVIIKDFFERSELDEFKEETFQIIRSYMNKSDFNKKLNKNETLKHGITILGKIDKKYIASIYDTIFQSPSFLRIVSGKKTSNVVNLLMGKEKDSALYGFTNRCRIDPPEDERRTYGWHQEVFYTIPKSNFIQTWCPLIYDTTIKNGTLELAESSHNKGILPQMWNEYEGKATQIIVDQSIINKHKCYSAEMKLGELLLFSGFLAHKSGRNTSEHVRYSLVGMYHDVASDGFTAPKLSFEFDGETPKQYFDKKFNEVNIT